MLFFFRFLSVVAFSYALKKKNISMSKSAQIRTIPGQFGKLFGAHYLGNRVAPPIIPRIPVFSVMNSTSLFISVGVNAAGKSAELARSLVGLTDWSGEDLFDFKPVSCSEVREVLTVMPSNKAPGYDRITPFVIKDCLSIILPTLTKLINSSFACSEFPRAWKKSVIVPFLKDGDHEVLNNNQPISLLPVLSKVAEKIAFMIQFNDFLTKQDKLTQHQLKLSQCMCRLCGLGSAVCRF